MIVLDANVIIAYLDGKNVHHQRAEELLAREIDDDLGVNSAVPLPTSPSTRGLHCPNVVGASSTCTQICPRPALMPQHRMRCSISFQTSRWRSGDSVCQKCCGLGAAHWGRASHAERETHLLTQRTRTAAW